MEQFMDWLAKYWAVLLVGAFSLIEIAPIKINPWSKIINAVGHRMNKDLMDDIKEIKKEQAEQREMIIANEKDRIRYEVLDFANSLRNGRKHTMDEYKHIVALDAKYKELLEMTNDTNGVFDLEYNYIVEKYHECQKNNSFLK